MDRSEALDRQLTAEVREAVKAAGLSQRDLAGRTGIPLVTLSRRLTGQGRGFTVDELLRIGEALGLSLVDLALRAERSPSSPCAKPTSPTRER